MEEVILTDQDTNFKYQISNRPGGEHFKRCFSCGTCTAACPVTEIDEDYNIVDRKANVSASDFVYGVFTFDTELPTSDNYLMIKYFRGVNVNDKIKYQLKELNKLLAVNWLFTNIPFSQLQRGITSWTLNGVNVTFDLSAMQSIIESNKKRGANNQPAIEYPSNSPPYIHYIEYLHAPGLLSHYL